MSSDLVKVEDRLLAITNLVLAGTPAEVIDRAAREKLGISKKDLATYLRRVATEIQKMGETKRTEAYAMAVARITRLFNAALGIQDYKTALSALKELHRLQGI